MAYAVIEVSLMNTSRLTSRSSIFHRTISFVSHSDPVYVRHLSRSGRERERSARQTLRFGLSLFEMIGMAIANRSAEICCD
jgi:hypothetical protein